MKPKVFVRAPFNYDADEASLSSGFASKDPTRTQQHQAEEADINTIVRRFGVTGQLPQVPFPPTFQDFSEVVFDYQSAQNLIRQAQESFNALPANVRTRFDNDPGKFVQFVSEPGHEAELRELGLLERRSDPPPAPIPGGATPAAPEAPKPA